MSFSQLLHILWARRVLVATVTIAMLVAAVVASLIVPRKYVATASLVIDPRGVDPVTGTSIAVQPAAGLLATQVDVIASRAVASRVVDELRAPGAPATDSGSAGEAAREAAVSALLQSVSVKPGADSNVLRIRFEDSDPDFAARAANAFADAYLRTSLELRLEPTRRHSAWFEEQLQSLRSNVEKQRESLSKYQRDNRLVATDERLDVETSRLDEISKQLLDAQRVSKETDARLRQTSQAMRSGRVQELPDMIGNGLLQTMKADLVRAEGRLAELSERLDRNHPQYMSAAAEVRTLREKLAAETRSTQGSIEQAAQIAQRQTADLQRAFDEQKSRILELRRQRDEIALRSREVENAQGAYDAALQRASQLRMESQLNQTSVAILDRATPPRYPATPGLTLSAALGIVFGVMLGGALALLLEMLDRRVRASEEFVNLTGVEVLIEVPRLQAGFRPGTYKAVRGSRATLDVKPA